MRLARTLAVAASILCAAYVVAASAAFFDVRTPAVADSGRVIVQLAAHSTVPREALLTVDGGTVLPVTLCTRCTSRAIYERPSGDRNVTVIVGTDGGIVIDARAFAYDPVCQASACVHATTSGISAEAPVRQNKDRYPHTVTETAIELNIVSRDTPLDWMLWFGDSLDFRGVALMFSRNDNATFDRIVEETGSHRMLSRSCAYVRDSDEDADDLLCADADDARVTWSPLSGCVCAVADLRVMRSVEGGLAYLDACGNATHRVCDPVLSGLPVLLRAPTSAGAADGVLLVGQCSLHVSHVHLLVSAALLAGVLLLGTSRLVAKRDTSVRVLVSNVLYAVLCATVPVVLSVWGCLSFSMLDFHRGHVTGTSYLYVAFVFAYALAHIVLSVVLAEMRHHDVHLANVPETPEVKRRYGQLPRSLRAPWLSVIATLVREALGMMSLLHLSLLVLFLHARVVALVVALVNSLVLVARPAKLTSAKGVMGGLLLTIANSAFVLLFLMMPIVRFLFVDASDPVRWLLGVTGVVTLAAVI